jgi:cyclic pyranopterin phosphate synthase
MGPAYKPAASAPLRITRPACALRVSITDRCNFRCRYCTPGDPSRVLQAGTSLSLDGLVSCVAWLQGELAIAQVKLTGGEPLVHSRVVELVARLARFAGIEEVSLTTNGSQLGALAEPLKRAGLARVNVSLDSVNLARFAQLTRGGRLEEVLVGIDAALSVGLGPVKLNAVLQRSGWRQDVPELLDFAAGRGLEIRFIELMRTATDRGWSASEYVSAEEVIDWLQRAGSVEFIERCSACPARRSEVQWRGSALRVGWITPRSRPFCGDCRRLRLDAAGRLRRCLMDPATLPLATLLAEAPPGRVRTVVADYLLGKCAPAAMDIEQPMTAVGG